MSETPIRYPITTVPPQDGGNAADLRRLASEREARINGLTGRVGELERQLESERLHRARVEADAQAARKSLIRLRKVLKNAYLTALEAGK
jgi:hypothetical protein